MAMSPSAPADPATRRMFSPILRSVDRGQSFQHLPDRSRRFRLRWDRSKRRQGVHPVRGPFPPRPEALPQEVESSEDPLGLLVEQEMEFVEEGSPHVPVVAFVAEIEVRGIREERSKPLGHSVFRHRLTSLPHPYAQK